MCYISVRPERHSYPILKRNMEFVINLTTKSMAFATDWCGVRSGKDYNKFEDTRARYSEFPKISFDYEVAEKAESVAVVPFNGEWKDLAFQQTDTSCETLAKIDLPSHSRLGNRFHFVTYPGSHCQLVDNLGFY